jgi:hypothetical protein
VKLLIEEMYPPALATALREASIDATTVAALRLAGSSDTEVFGAAVAGGYALLTENVGDFTRIAAEHSTAGGHHNGLLIALSSRFSRRPAGIKPLIAAIQAVAEQHLEDRVIYLKRSNRTSGRAHLVSARSGEGGAALVVLAPEAEQDLPPRSPRTE